MFGIVAVLIELFRPSYVDYVVPIWVIFVVAAVSGIFSVIHKLRI